MPKLIRVLCAPVALVVLSLAVVVSPAAAKQNEFAGLVTEDAFGGSVSYRDSALNKIAATGAGTIRQTMDWATIEPIAGDYDWRRYDAFMASTAKRGIRVMPILFNAPAWASSRPATGAERGTYPPRDVNQFAAFAQVAAKRYGPGGTFWDANRNVTPMPITSWQVWNEANLHIYWLPKSNASQYVAMLRAVSKAIKAVNPAAEIVTAGMPNSRLGIKLNTFVGQLYDAGGADTFDTIAVNPYAKNAKGVLNLLKGVRKVMNAKGDTSGGIRASEIGWADSGPHNSFVLGPKGQAKAITAVMSSLYAQRSALNLKGVIYYNWRDAKPYPGGKEFWGLHTGLLKKNGSAKPALKSFESAAKKLK